MHCKRGGKDAARKNRKANNGGKNEKKTTAQSSGKFLDNPGRAALYDILHSDGWDAVDMLNSVKEAFDKAIDETQDAEIKGELEKSRSLVIQSKKAYLKAANRLRHIF